MVLELDNASDTEELKSLFRSLLEVGMVKTGVPGLIFCMAARKSPGVYQRVRYKWPSEPFKIEHHSIITTAPQTPL